MENFNKEMGKKDTYIYFNFATLKDFFKKKTFSTMNLALYAKVLTAA